MIEYGQSCSNWRVRADKADWGRSINKGKYQIAFVLKAPLYLFCVSDWGEPEHVVCLLSTQTERAMPTQLRRS